MGPCCTATKVFFFKLAEELIVSQSFRQLKKALLLDTLIQRVLRTA